MTDQTIVKTAARYGGQCMRVIVQIAWSMPELSRLQMAPFDPTTLPVTVVLAARPPSRTARPRRCALPHSPRSPRSPRAGGGREGGPRPRAPPRPWAPAARCPPGPGPPSGAAGALWLARLLPGYLCLCRCRCSRLVVVADVVVGVAAIVRAGVAGGLNSFHCARCCWWYTRQKHVSRQERQADQKSHHFRAIQVLALVCFRILRLGSKQGIVPFVAE